MATFTFLNEIRKIYPPLPAPLIPSGEQAIEGIEQAINRGMAHDAAMCWYFVGQVDLAVSYLPGAPRDRAERLVRTLRHMARLCDERDAQAKECPFETGEAKPAVDERCAVCGSASDQLCAIDAPSDEQLHQRSDDWDRHNDSWDDRP